MKWYSQKALLFLFLCTFKTHANDLSCAKFSWCSMNVSRELEDLIKVEVALCESELNEQGIECSEENKKTPKYKCHPDRFCDSRFQSYNDAGGQTIEECLSGFFEPIKQGLKGVFVDMPVAVATTTYQSVQTCIEKPNCLKDDVLPENTQALVSENIAIYNQQIMDQEKQIEKRACSEQPNLCALPEISCREWERMQVQGIDLESKYGLDGAKKVRFCQKANSELASKLDNLKNAQARVAAQALTEWLKLYKERKSCYHPRFLIEEGCKLLGVGASIATVPLLVSRILSLAAKGLTAKEILGKLKSETFNMHEEGASLKVVSENIEVKPVAPIEQVTVNKKNPTPESWKLSPKEIMEKREQIKSEVLERITKNSDDPQLRKMIEIIGQERVAELVANRITDIQIQRNGSSKFHGLVSKKIEEVTRDFDNRFNFPENAKGGGGMNVERWNQADPDDRAKFFYDVLSKPTMKSKEYAGKSRKFAEREQVRQQFSTDPEAFSEKGMLSVVDKLKRRIEIDRRSCPDCTREGIFVRTNREDHLIEHLVDLSSTKVNVPDAIRASNRGIVQVVGEISEKKADLNNLSQSLDIIEALSVKARASKPTTVWTRESSARFMAEYSTKKMTPQNYRLQENGNAYFEVESGGNRVAVVFCAKPPCPNPTSAKGNIDTIFPICGPDVVEIPSTERIQKLTKFLRGPPEGKALNSTLRSGVPRIKSCKH